jgi:hypothetical protein
LALYDAPELVDINENQVSKPIVQQYPPLALMEKPTLMETIRHGNINAHAPPLIISPHQCFYLSTFDINGKGYLPLGLLPLTELSLGILLLSALYFGMLPLSSNI